MRTGSFVSAVALLASALAAQTIGAPAIFANAEGGSSGNIFVNGLNRVQCFYDSTNFATQGVDSPIIVNNLEWRAAGAAIGVAGTYSSAEIYMGYAASDFSTPSTTFATNRTASHTLVYSGPLSFAAAAGTTPNSWFINQPLSTPFSYDPSTGQDLLIEIVLNVAPGVAPATLSTGYSNPAHLCHSVRSVFSNTALTGSASAFCPVVRMTYTEPAGAAKRFSYGTGCLAQTVSFGEQFAGAAFDLGTASGTNSYLLTPNALGGYTVTPGSNNWWTPVSADLALGDDAVSAAQTLPFTFNYPGSATGTTAVVVGSNGSVWLSAAATATTATGAVSDLATGLPRLVPLWTDFDPTVATGAGTIIYDADAINGAAYVTWTGVAMWEATPSTPRFLNTFQVALFASGAVELRYQACSAPTYNIVTGFSPGNGARTPTAIDFTTALPFSSAADAIPLSLSSNVRPVLGTAVTLTTGNIPAAAVVSFGLLSFTQFAPGVDLTALGMPGCFQHAGFDAVSLLLGTPSATQSLTMPSSVSWIGAQLYSQSVSLVPGVNAAGAVTSNGLRLLLGSL